MSFTYTNWRENAPNNTNNEEHFTEMWKSNGLWNDEKNSYQSPPICQSGNDLNINILKSEINSKSAPIGMKDVTSNTS